jgi:hypothetical protein
LIKKLISTEPWHVTILVALHIFIGVVSTITPFALIALYYAVLLLSVKYLFNPSGYPVTFIAILSYLTSFDVIGRMASTSPFIPYELSKYLMFLLLVWAIARSRSSGYFYMLIPLLLIPAFLFDFSGQTGIADVINNGIAPINMGLAMLYFFKRKINIDHLHIIMNMVLYSSIMVLAFAFFRTPDYDEIEFNLVANFDTSGGFGSNQVSTILGLGGFLMATNLVAGKKLTRFRWLDIGLLFGFVFQGLLTFSRGGMLGMALGVAVFIYYATISKTNQAIKLKFSKSKIIAYAVVAFFVVGVGFLVVDNLTGSTLSLRYKGETAGTQAGSKDKNLNTITTNRFEIFMGDIDLWLEEPLFGVGVGASKYLRKTVENVVAHVELSRLLAEHGILGLLVFLIWILAFFRIRNNSQHPLGRAILSAFFVLALYTSFHAAMRTYVTPLLTGLAMMSVVVPASKNKNSSTATLTNHKPINDK